MSDSVAASVVVGILKAALVIYDFVSFPMYFILQRPWIRMRLARQTRAIRLKADDPTSAYVNVLKPPPHIILECDTLPRLFKKAVEIYGHRKCLGQREVFGEEEETQSDGKKFQKLNLGDYKWFSYSELDQRIDVVAKGLMSTGIKPGDIIMMLAETRLEWYLTAQAVFRVGATIATLYTTLGNDGIVHGLNETQVTHMVTTFEFLPKLKQLAPQIPNLKCIIYIESYRQAAIDGFKITLISFSQMEEQGRSSSGLGFVEAKPTDPAVIMYTSGSTGIPKGVIILQKNVIATIRGFYGVANELTEGHIYMAFLPLAHVLEIAAESYFISAGCSIGYSSANTMTDKSTAIKRGARGDAVILKPNSMASVPLVLERIRKLVCAEVESKGNVSKAIFHFLIEYKKFWTKRGFKTPILNYLMFRRIQKLFGGNLQYMVTGSAPISPDTHDFIRACLNIVLVQGYGLTETASGATLMDFNDLSVGRCGPPLYGVQIRLQDWLDGNYSVNDKPNPRGEILIGGDCVTAGYFKNDALTNESFKELDGVRWFMTGDIGEIHPDGTIQIVDRKKDLVKLQFGEYVSLGKVETELKQLDVVDNICVYADSKHTYVIALVVPNPGVLQNMAKHFGKENLSWADLCKDQQVNDEVLTRIVERSKKAKLHKMEIPAKVKICPEVWSPENGLVTAALKIRRKNIEEKYKASIERIYSSSSPE